MMRFKSTKNIFVDRSEIFDPNWFDSDKLILPPKTLWDNKRDMKIEDVDVWEVIFESGGDLAVYAAWSPYAEFYLIRVGWYLEAKGYGVETYYGPGAQALVRKRMNELGIPYVLNKVWVEPSEMHLYVK